MFTIVYISKSWILLAITLRLKCHIPIALNLNLMFLFVSDCSKTWSTNLINVILYVLNGLKRYTFSGCKTCDVWDGKVIMSNPNYSIYGPFRTKNYLFMKNIPPKTNFLKIDNKNIKICKVFSHHINIICWCASYGKNLYKWLI
jgi:hypothetical protein